MRPLKALALLAISAVVPFCAAQLTVKRVIYRDAGTYTPTELNAIAALKAGDRIGSKELSAAAQRLMDTGVFADIDTTIEGPPAAADIVFKLKPATPDAFLPVSFDNLVWLAPEDRDAELRRRVPLYNGTVPTAGNMQAAVQAALQAMLAEKAVQATVACDKTAGTETRANVIVTCAVTSPAVVLSNVRLAGVAPEMAASENTALRAMVGRPFNEGIDSHLLDKLLNAYRDAGYLDAKILNFQRTPTEAAGKVNVVLSGVVSPGDAYRVGELRFAGSPLYSAADFARDSKLHKGDVASGNLLIVSYRPLLQIYHQRGYADAVVTVSQKHDTTAHTVDYDFSLTPGEPYRVGTVAAHGLDPKARKDFDSAWKLTPGTVYDSVYAEEFLHANANLHSLDPYTAAYKTTLHPETHTADIVMTFFANNPH